MEKNSTTAPGLFAVSDFGNKRFLRITKVIEARLKLT